VEKCKSDIKGTKCEIINHTSGTNVFKVFKDFLRALFEVFFVVFVVVFVGFFLLWGLRNVGAAYEFVRLSSFSLFSVACVRW
jgi:hypothetical protein